MKRLFALVLAAAFAMLAPFAPAVAQDYPSRPVTLVVTELAVIEPTPDGFVLRERAPRHPARGHPGGNWRSPAETRDDPRDGLLEARLWKR